MWNDAIPIVSQTTTF